MYKKKIMKSCDYKNQYSFLYVCVKERRHKIYTAINDQLETWIV